jgi:hypothetical protein
VTRPVFVLGVSRSGTTLLRVILDRSPGIAIPEESRFIPLLWRRHRRSIDPDRFRDDLRRIPALRRWDLDAESVSFAPGSSTSDAIAAVFEAYARQHAKPRWGDKTPMYMRHLTLLERLFSDAQYVHLIRDGRDVGVSFLAMPEGTYTRTWAYPSTPARFACQWRTEVEAGRALGARVGTARYFEVRYEELVAEPERVVRSICDFAGLAFEAAMLEYPGAVDVSAKPHHQGLREPPTVGRRDWRRELSAHDARAFEAVAGDLLADLGYETGSSTRGRMRASAALASYRARTRAWDTAAALTQRSPLWRRRHPPLAGP